MTPAAAALATGSRASGSVLAADDTGKAGPLGLLVLILLGISCYFLFRSMSRHLRRVREGFPVGVRADTDTSSDRRPGGGPVPGDTAGLSDQPADPTGATTAHDSPSPP